MSHYRQFLVGVVVLLALQESSRTVCAECGGPVSPCDSWRQSSIVFVRDVVEAGSHSEVSGTEVKPAPQTARFKIIERFKGIPVDHQEITARIAHPSVESVFVAAGVRYLVYAHERSDEMWDTTCSRTKPVRDAAQDLAELRTWRM